MRTGGSIMLISISEKIESLNGTVSAFVWGAPMLALILIAGIYFTLKTDFFQLRHARHIANSTFLAIFKKKSVTRSSDKKSISQFQAMSTALAGTIGTGNIAGVATAITLGGAGAVFWMWVSAFLGMMTGFSENVLGIYYRKKNKAGGWNGGPMYYLEEGLKSKKGLGIIAKPLAVIFSAFCILGSLGMGNMTQANSISTSLQASFSVPPLLTGLIVAAVSAFVIIGGAKRIASVTEKLVPFMAVAYIALTVMVCITNYKNLPSAFMDIFRGAFGFSAVTGGISGALMKQAISMGLKRGVFSNEAGLGSSVLVHTSADVSEPVTQGMWSIFEIFFDTIVMCTLTALAILSAGVAGTTDAAGNIIDGAPLVVEAFSKTFGRASGGIVSLSVLLFAFSTLIGWSFFGTKAVEYLFTKKAVKIYKIVYVIFIVIGSTMDLRLVWSIADTLNGLMVLPNLTGVLALSGTVFKISKNYTDREIKKLKKPPAPMLSAYPEIEFEQVFNSGHQKNRHTSTQKPSSE